MKGRLSAAVKEESADKVTHLDVEVVYVSCILDRQMNIIQYRRVIATDLGCIHRL